MSPLPIELCAAIVEYAADAAIYDCNWSWVAKLCTVCQFFLSPTRSILYDTIWIHPTNFYALSQRTKNTRTWFALFTRQVVIDLDTQDRKILLEILFAVPRLESIYFAPRERFPPSVKVLHLNPPRNPGWSALLRATVQFLQGNEVAFVTHWHFPAFLNSAELPIAAFESAVLDSCSLTHVLIDFDSAADSDMTGYSSEQLIELAKVWTRPPSLTRLLFRPRPLVFREVEAASSAVIRKQMIRDLERFAIATRDDRIWVQDELPALFDESSSLALRIRDLREGPDLWLSGRSLYNAPSPNA
ncbi:hypothetical protein BKA62DRAFT_793491 [Auriculariales sp. MPI-PUGE-AT-0066]|nr:hypothetical protein BKA62DRAFT_793491 [Auriculariales sp. MPI-PUGE-AT-0066]